MKNIKDYLHLYLGCEVRIADEKFSKSGLKLIGINDMGCQVRDDGIKLTFYVKPDDVKPLLRLLSDITEEENKESSKLYFEFMEKQNPGTRSILMMSAMTQWFLSKHFDLFNLIPEGLAIDKTTLNANQPKPNNK